MGGRNPKNSQHFNYRIFCSPETGATSFMSFRTRGGGRGGGGPPGLDGLALDNVSSLPPGWGGGGGPPGLNGLALDNVSSLHQAGGGGGGVVHQA